MFPVSFYSCQVARTIMVTGSMWSRDTGITPTFHMIFHMFPPNGNIWKYGLLKHNTLGSEGHHFEDPAKRRDRYCQQEKVDPRLRVMTRSRAGRESNQSFRRPRGLYFPRKIMEHECTYYERTYYECTYYWDASVSFQYQRSNRLEANQDPRTYYWVLHVSVPDVGSSFR